MLSLAWQQMLFVMEKQEDALVEGDAVFMKKHKDALVEEDAFHEKAQRCIC